MHLVQETEIIRSELSSCMENRCLEYCSKHAMRSDRDELNIYEYFCQQHQVSQTRSGGNKLTAPLCSTNHFKI